jgi:lysophospholipase L1-like esterase
MSLFISEYNCRIRYLTLIFLALLIACAPQPPISAPVEVTSMPSIKYLALGDSYTIGTSVEETERWPAQLAERLRADGLQVELTIIAHDGWTTDELWQGIREQSPQPPFDMVSLLIGVNNQYRGYDIEQYRRQFAMLLAEAVEYAGGNASCVIVVSIPDWGVTPYASEHDRDREHVAGEIDAFNAVNREETLRAGARYVDITPVSRRAANDESLLAADRLHPSAAMYQMWVDLVYPIAMNILGR